MKMKTICFIVMYLFIGTEAFSQKLNWIPFEWVEDSISGRYFDKAAIIIPVNIDDLPHDFNMQFDLGASETVIYGNSFDPYLNKYPKINEKLDSSQVWIFQGDYKLQEIKNVKLNLGTTSFGNRDIGYVKEYGEVISADSIYTETPIHIGTIGSDLFKEQFLIIDYPNQRICVTDTLTEEFQNVNFQPAELAEGRITIPLTINGKVEYLMYDTGSSIFNLVTTEENANRMSENVVIDSLSVNSWGDYLAVFGQKITADVKFGNITLPSANVYYIKNPIVEDFFKQQNIWGITGNAYFLNKIVIIDYKNSRFGIK